MPHTWRWLDVAALALIVVLTLSTAYIHFWVGGLMLMLNSLGYVGLAALVVLSAAFYRRALSLVLIMLALYAATTIIGWLIMGPYFDVAYLAKGIEIVLIATIALFEYAHRAELREAITWARTLGSSRLGREPAPGSAEE
jgi:hypothetical protein